MGCEGGQGCSSERAETRARAYNLSWSKHEPYRSNIQNNLETVDTALIQQASILGTEKRKCGGHHREDKEAEA